jgi:cytidylate kinase
MTVVSISRQFGAGGRFVAEEISRRLGFEFVDDELVKRVAQEANVADEWIRVTEREAPGGSKVGVSGLFSTALLYRLLGQSPKGDHAGEVLKSFTRVIPEIASRDHVVFLGRGSQFLLADDVNNVKILLVATEGFRVQFLMENYRLPYQEALPAVQEWERNRLSFLGRLTNKDPNDPLVYDLTINTTVVRPHWAVGLICDLIAKREKDFGNRV